MRARGGGRWRPDARIVGGAVLIVAAAAGTAALVVASGPGDDALVTGEALLPGDVVDPAAAGRVAVDLERAAGRYLSADALEDGLVVVEPVGAGELIPARAVAPAARAGTSRVVIGGGARLPRDIAPGAAVDVWSAPEDAERDPEPLVERAPVVDVSERDGFGGAAAEVEVEVLVPSAALPGILAAAGDVVVVESVVPSERPE